MGKCGNMRFGHVLNSFVPQIRRSTRTHPAAEMVIIKMLGFKSSCCVPNSYKEIPEGEKILFSEVTIN